MVAEHTQNMSMATSSGLAPQAQQELANALQHLNQSVVSISGDHIKSVADVNQQLNKVGDMFLAVDRVCSKLVEAIGAFEQYTRESIANTRAEAMGAAEALNVDLNGT